MGGTSSSPTAFNDPAKEIKVFRQLRAEYERKTEEGLDSADLKNHLKKVYQTLLTDYSGPQKLPDGTFVKVPTVRFGRTEIQMPILSLGTMRFQQTWAPWDKFTMDNVDEACQKNLDAILARAFELGINHVEAARAYGSSELQLGVALKKFNREDFILQSKIRPMADPEAFRNTLETSFKNLQVDRLDLVAFHGINTEKFYDYTMREGGCLEVLQEYQKAGKVGHIGFSTHACTPLVVRAIETGVFDYVNLHYHFVGSYTSSGTGKTSAGNLEALQAAQRHDMGVFIISGADKGGMLYKPSKAFSACCLPDATPIGFNNLWLWNHDPPVHTIVIGASRPADLDEGYASALLYESRAEITSKIQERLLAVAVKEVGQEWLDTWWQGLPNVFEHPTGTNISTMVWLWTLLKCYGMYDFCKARYDFIVVNNAKWDDTKTAEENWEAISFDWVPGCGYREGVDYSPFLTQSPHAEKIPSILEETHNWLKNESVEEMKEWRENAGWVAAYDLQPDIPFPEKIPVSQQYQIAKQKNEEAKSSDT